MGGEPDSAGQKKTQSRTLLEVSTRENSTWQRNHGRNRSRLAVGIAKEFLVREPHPADKEGIHPQGGKRGILLSRNGSHHIILVHSVTTDTQSTKQGRAIIVVKRPCSREKDHPVLVLDGEIRVGGVKIPLRHETGEPQHVVVTFYAAGEAGCINGTIVFSGRQADFRVIQDRENGSPLR